MASLFTHVFTAAALAPVCAPRPGWKWTIPAGILASTIPDADVIGFEFGVRYGDFLGHRGFSHSFFFALLIALSLMWMLRRPTPLSPGGRSWQGLYFFLCAASHGLLDAMTDGGLGIGLFMPFENGRHFLPWDPIPVSPIGVANFFDRYGWEVLKAEMRVVWAPLGALALLCWWGRARLRPAARD